MSSTIFVVFILLWLVMEDASVSLVSDEIEVCVFFGGFFSLAALDNPFLYEGDFTDFAMSRTV